MSQNIYNHKNVDYEINIFVEEPISFIMLSPRRELSTKLMTNSPPIIKYMILSSELTL